MIAAIELAGAGMCWALLIVRQLRRCLWAVRRVLADRGVRTPSPHTLEAYQDFDAIAALTVGGDDPGAARLQLADITTASLAAAFSPGLARTWPGATWWLSQ